MAYAEMKVDSFLQGCRRQILRLEALELGRIVGAYAREPLRETRILPQ
jgi:hypothetical protein